jgi:hypothetical protein
MSFFKKSQIKADVWQLAHVNPFVQLYTMHQTIEDVRAGDREGAMDNIERGLTGAMIGGVGGFGVAYPGIALRVLRTAHKASPSQSIPGYGPVDYVMDLKGERDRNDLEAGDFLFYALPEVAQIAIKRWTNYDLPPEVLLKLVTAELPKISIPAGAPSTGSKSSRSKSKKKKTQKKGSTGGPKYCKIHKKFDFCYRK